MITKRERLQAAIEGEVADRPAVALWRHFPVDDQDPKALAEATAAFQQDFNFDFVKVTPASSFCVRDWGVEDEWLGSTEGTRKYTRRVIRDLKDWRKINVLDPGSGALKDQLTCLEILRQEVDSEVPIIQTIFSPLAQAKNLAGQEVLFDHLHRDPEFVEAGLNTITQSVLAFIDSVRSIDIDGIFYAIQHASYEFFDQQSYARFGETFDQVILASTEDFWLNVLHLHGKSLMFDLAEKYPVQVVNWHDRETWPDLEEGKNRTAAAVCGGISRETMVLGDPQGIVREAKEAIDSMKGGRGFVLGTGCVVPVIAPRVNIKTAREIVDFA
jgi:uroporphyrinogen decarboxylase